VFIFRISCSHNVSITQTTTFSYRNPLSKASGTTVALFQFIQCIFTACAKILIF